MRIRHERERDPIEPLWRVVVELLLQRLDDRCDVELSELSSARPTETDARSFEHGRSDVAWLETHVHKALEPQMVSSRYRLRHAFACAREASAGAPTLSSCG